MVLNHVAGATACEALGKTTLATATMTVDFKGPVDTPGVVLVRAWAVAREGRKTWVQARIEDPEGRLLAGAKVLFIDEKPTKL